MSAPTSPEQESSKRTLTPHGAAQYRALVVAAFGLIAEGGFENLRTRDVAARAGVNIATLHYYFATKEDLIRAVVGLLVDKFRNVRAPSDEPPMEGALEVVRQELLDVPYQVREDPELPVVLFELLLRSLRDESTREAMLGLTTQWQKWIRSYLQVGVDEGAFRADLDVAVAAIILSSLLSGYTMTVMINLDAAPPESIFAEVRRWLSP